MARTALGLTLHLRYRGPLLVADCLRCTLSRSALDIRRMLARYVRTAATVVSRTSCGIGVQYSRTYTDRAGVYVARTNGPRRRASRARAPRRSPRPPRAAGEGDLRVVCISMCWFS